MEQSEWMQQAMKRATTTLHECEPKFKGHWGVDSTCAIKIQCAPHGNMLKCNCINAMVTYSNDGNRHQKCMGCGATWDAPTRNFTTYSPNVDDDKVESDDDDDDKVYDIMLPCACGAKGYTSTDDGNRWQQCDTCGSTWDASDNGDDGHRK